MKLFRWISVLAIALALGAVMVHRVRGQRRGSGSIPQSAYVWQRAWTPGVREAVRASGRDFTGDVVLAAEATFRSGQCDVACVAVDYPSLKAAGVPVGLALRVGRFRGVFSDHDASAQRLSDLAATLVADAQKAGVSPAELQIDFDAGESQLGGYCLWVAAIKKRVAPVPVTITALPAWLGKADFPRLAKTAGGYVLQVHSLNRPTSAAATMTLCDADAARRAVELAGHIGIPFRVALPTYGYLVAFDVQGQFQGLSAEGPSLDWPAGAVVRTLRADPAAMAALVSQWTVDRPRCMTGVIWYRLPTADDSLNWRLPTLRAVMAGRSPRADLRVEVVRSEPQVFEIHLCNAGDADAPMNSQVTVHWQGQDLVAADALGGFEENDEAAHVTLRPSVAVVTNQQLAPGERRAIAWMRFNQDKEIQADVSPITR